MAGAPRQYDRDEVLQRLESYIDSTPDPILPEFCSIKGNPCKDTLYEWAKESQPLSDALKRIVVKQESYLLRQSDRPIMAIFRLKQPQHGYTDKQIVDTTVTNRTIRVEIVSDTDVDGEQ